MTRNGAQATQAVHIIDWRVIRIRTVVKLVSQRNVFCLTFFQIFELNIELVDFFLVDERLENEFILNNQKKFAA
jgi:hypothetical protein